jgi:DNA-binding HxlR family transcriptional regulator
MKICPIDNSLRIFGHKYALHIIRNILLLKQNRFSQLLRSIEGINTKTLSIRLRELENFGLIKRTIVNRRPVQTEYSLTEKGMALEPILAHIAVFLQDKIQKKFLRMASPETQFSKFLTLILYQEYMINYCYNNSFVIVHCIWLTRKY